jgi:hypothetical protein
MKLTIKAAVLAYFCAAAFSPAHALVIGVADAENSIPFGSTGGGFVYQQVYNQANFNSPISIGEITFYDSINPGGVPRTGNFDIYLSTTSLPVGNALGIPLTFRLLLLLPRSSVETCRPFLTAGWILTTFSRRLITIRPKAICC